MKQGGDMEKCCIIYLHYFYTCFKHKFALGGGVEIVEAFRDIIAIYVLYAVSEIFHNLSVVVYYFVCKALFVFR